MENAQNFAAIVSSMVLEPSLFDPFLMFSQFWVFVTGLVTAWAAAWGCCGTPRGLPGALWGPRGPKKGFLGFWGRGGPVPGLSRVCPGLIPLYYRNPLVGGSGACLQHTQWMSCPKGHAGSAEMPLLHPVPQLV